MWNATPALRDALAGDYELATVVDVLRDGQLVAAGLDVVDVSVDATLTTTDGRSARLVVERAITDAGLLNPLSDLVVVRTGIAGIELVPLFTGRVDAHAEAETGEVGVSCMSRRVELSRAPFEVPFAVRSGATVVAEIRRAVADIDPTWAVDATRLSGTAVAKLVPAGLMWEEDRGRAIDDLSAAIQALWLPDRTGGITLLPSQFADQATAEPVMTLRDGEDGCLVQVGQVRSRQDIRNSVTVVVERTDNSLPVRVTVRDTDPGSATFWGGPFGKQNAVVKINTPLTAIDASLLATRILRASLALARSWRIDIPHNPLLDPGDVIGVWYQGEPTMQLVESIAHSGAATRTTTIATRQITS